MNVLYVKKNVFFYAIWRFFINFAIEIIKTNYNEYKNNFNGDDLPLCIQ